MNKYSNRNTIKILSTLFSPSLSVKLQLTYVTQHGEIFGNLFIPGKWRFLSARSSKWNKSVPKATRYKLKLHGKKLTMIVTAAHWLNLATQISGQTPSQTFRTGHRDKKQGSFFCGIPLLFCQCPWKPLLATWAPCTCNAEWSNSHCRLFFPKYISYIEQEIFHSCFCPPNLSRFLSCATVTIINGKFPFGKRKQKTVTMCCRFTPKEWQVSPVFGTSSVETYHNYNGTTPAEMAK